MKVIISQMKQNTEFIINREIITMEHRLGWVNELAKKSKNLLPDLNIHIAKLNDSSTTTNILNEIGLLNTNTHYRFPNLRYLPIHIYKIGFHNKESTILIISKESDFDAIPFPVSSGNIQAVIILKESGLKFLRAKNKRFLFNVVEQNCMILYMHGY